MKLLYDNITNYSDKDYEFFLNLINNDKCSKIKKITNINAKKRSILGEFLLIQLLESINIDYNKIIFENNIYGKPYIQNYPIYFNISHSNDYVICCISENEIGIDIEKIKDITYSTCKQYATNIERDYINFNEFNFQKRAFEIFVLKESYFKCLGLNLNNIQKIDFKIHKNIIKCSDKNVICNLLYDIPNYVIAICEKSDFNEK